MEEKKEKEKTVVTPKGDGYPVITIKSYFDKPGIIRVYNEYDGRGGYRVKPAVTSAEALKRMPLFCALKYGILDSYFEGDIEAARKLSLTEAAAIDKSRRR